MDGNKRSELAGWAPVALRLAVGLVFVAHGYDKVFVKGVPAFAHLLGANSIPGALFMAWLSALTELLGGAAMLLGVAVRWVAVPMAFNMLVAISLVHYRAFFLPPGMEYALTLLLVLVALYLTGAGPLSVDDWLASRRPAEQAE